MATRSPQGVGQGWSTVSTPNDLYNTATGPSVGSKLAVGDSAYVISNGLVYTCTDPTVGAAIWTDSAPKVRVQTIDFSTSGAVDLLALNVFLGGLRYYGFSAKILRLVLSQTAGGTGTTTVELFKVSLAGAETSLGTASINGSGTNVFGDNTSFAGNVSASDRLGIKFTSTQTSGGTDATVSVVLAAGLTDVVTDATPQLGSNLELNSFKLTSAANGDIVLNAGRALEIPAQFTAPFQDLVPSGDPASVTSNLALGNNFRFTVSNNTRLSVPALTQPGTQAAWFVKQNVFGGNTLNLSEFENIFGSEQQIDTRAGALNLVLGVEGNTGWKASIAREPTLHSGLQVWWRHPDNITFDFGDLTAWGDKQGNLDLDVVTSAPPSYPRTFPSPQNGTDGDITVISPNIFQLYDIASFFPLSTKNEFIRFSSGVNAGTHFITDRTSANSIEFYNPRGGADLSPGSWSISENPEFNTTDIPFFIGEFLQSSGNALSVVDPEGYTLIVLSRVPHHTSASLLSEINGVGTHESNVVRWGITHSSDSTTNNVKVAAVHTDTSSGTLISTPISILKNEWNIVHSRFDTVTNAVSLGINEDIDNVQILGAGALDISKLALPIVVGSYDGSVSNLNIPEVRIYNRRLNDFELIAEVRKIADFWGLAL